MENLKSLDGDSYSLDEEVDKWVIINDVLIVIEHNNSISEAARIENLARGSISKCVNGSTRYSCVGGRIWKKEAMPHE